MSWSLGSGAGNKDAVSVTANIPGVGAKAVQQAYVGTAGGNKLFFEALTASAAPSSRLATGIGVITTGFTSVTPTGGTAPYTYAWSVDNPAITINSPSSPTTSFTSTPGAGNTVTGDASCLVTDANGFTATTNDVAISMTDVT